MLCLREFYVFSYPLSAKKSMINFTDREDRANFAKTFLIGGAFIMSLWALFPFFIRRGLDPILGSLKMPVCRWLGCGLSVFGYVLAVWCVMLFIREGKGTPLPYAHPKRLVVSGPYRFVRNPMVIGTVFFLLGSAFLVGSAGIFLYALVLFGIMHAFVLVEEKALLSRFGRAYAAYLQQTPRWWPKFNLSRAPHFIPSR